MSAEPRTPSAIAPVSVAMRTGLHALVVALTLYVVVRASIALAENGSRPGEWVVLTLAAAFLVVYAAGGRRPGPVWALALTVVWAALALLTVDAAFLAFPLFFVLLTVLRLPWNVIGVVLLTGAAIVLLAMHLGWSAGGVLGPVIGAAVATALGLGYQALLAEGREREVLIDELLATRDRLAAAEREAGATAERERLAREIHDTVAQGLSSIQLLLHAAERAEPGHPSAEHLRLARETAAANLAEARRFIRELSPPDLDGRSLAAALRRVADAFTATSAVPATVHVSGDPLPLAPEIESALLRIAQGSLANTARHAAASRVELTLSYLGDAIALDIVDDGRGFSASGRADAREHAPGSFGLLAMRERAAALGGTLAVESRAGAGTTIAAHIPVTT